MLEYYANIRSEAKMTTRNLAIVATLVALAAVSATANSAGSGGETVVRLTPCDAGVVVKGYSPREGLVALSPDALLPRQKLPKASGRMLFGALRIGPSQTLVNVAVEELGSPKGKSYKVFFDRNANSNLTDDGSPKPQRLLPGRPIRGEETIKNGQRVTKLRYSLELGKRSYLRYWIATGRQGTLVVGGRKLKLVVLDGNADGSYGSLDSDLLAADLNGDGVLDGRAASDDGNPLKAGEASRGAVEIFPLGRDFTFAGSRWWVEDAAPDGAWIKLSHETLASSSQTGRIEKPVVGYFAPSFRERATNGQMISLEALRGKVVLLDFWATWCGPCRRELPNVIKLYNRFKGKNFALIGISLDVSIDDLRSFVSENGMPWPQVFDGRGWDNKIATLYNVRAIPSSFLLDKDGKIIAKDLRGQELAAAVERALRAEGARLSEE